MGIHVCDDDNIIDDDLLWKLNGETVLVDRDFLDQVPALYPDLLLGDEVLDDHVRHVLAVGVPACTHN